MQQIQTKPQSIEESSLYKSARPTENTALIATFKAISHILAIRLFLLLSVIGSFVLAFMAMSSTDSHSVWTLATYNALTTLPLVVWDLMARGNK